MSACSDGRRASRPTPISDSSCSAASFMTNSTTTRPTNTFAGNAASKGTRPPISAMCQSAPSTTTSLNRNGTAARPSASIGRSGRASPNSAASDPPRIDAIGDRRVGDVEAHRVPPRSGQLPERKRVVALIGEEREGGGVDKQRRSRQGAEKGPPPQREPRRAGEAGEDPFAGGQRRIDRRGDQHRAGRRRGQRSALRTAVRADVRHGVRLCGNFRSSSFKLGLAGQESQPNVRASIHDNLGLPLGAPSRSFASE